MYYHIFIFVVIRKYIGIIFSEVQERVSMATKFGRPRIKRNNESRQKNEQKKKNIYYNLFNGIPSSARYRSFGYFFAIFFLYTVIYIFFFFSPRRRINLFDFN